MSTACPVCGDERGRILFSRPPDNDPDGRVFSVIRCARCRVERLDPLPTEAELDAAYGDEYYVRHSPDRGFAGRLRRLAWAAEIRPLARHLRPGIRVLEIGCGTGELLFRLRERFRAEVEGIERSAPAVAACRRRGIAVHQGSLGDAPIRPSSVDIVMMRHVLEHVPSPRGLLDNVREILAPQGLLLVTVPVTGGWDHRLFGDEWDGYRIPEHLFHFPGPALDRLISDSGFVVQTRRYSWVPNPWINSTQRILHRRGAARAARAASIRNPVALALAAPVSAAAALSGRSGRLTVLARVAGGRAI